MTKSRGRKGEGSIILRGRFYSIKYRCNGRDIWETTGSVKRSVAQRLLRERLSQIQQGEVAGPKAIRLTFGDLLTEAHRYYRTLSSYDRAKNALTHLESYFSGWKVRNIDYSALSNYLEHRRDQHGAADSSIQYELRILHKTMVECVKKKLMAHVPIFPSCGPGTHNARQGFFEREQFESVRTELPRYLKHLVTVVYHTGARYNTELLGNNRKGLREVAEQTGRPLPYRPMEWRDIDWEEGTLTIPNSKTKDSRVIPFATHDELKDALQNQLEYTREVEKRTGRIVSYVFHNEGKPIKDFGAAWRGACDRAGVKAADGNGMLRHDFRRTASRNLTRAGVPRRVAMEITGHKTEAMFARYDITDRKDVTEAMAKLSDHQKHESESAKVVNISAGHGG